MAYPVLSYVDGATHPVKRLGITSGYRQATAFEEVQFHEVSSGKLLPGVAVATQNAARSNLGGASSSSTPATRQTLPTGQSSVHSLCIADPDQAPKSKSLSSFPLQARHPQVNFKELGDLPRRSTR